MMYCEDDGFCHNGRNYSFLANMVESFAPGTPFSAFLIAAEICLCLTVFASVPSTRKDSIFCFLAITFAPFFTMTCVEVAYFISIYFYTSSFTFWSSVHDSVVSFCYSSFLFNFQYGMVFYSSQSIVVAVRKKPVAKSSARWPYIIIFVITLIQATFFWQIMILGVISMFLVLVLAPLCLVVTIFCLLFCKTNEKSEHEVVRLAKSRMLWNVPCLLLTMTDAAAHIYLTTKSVYFTNDAIRSKEYLFSILFPTVATIIMLITLPALRRAVFPCFYANSPALNSDRMFLITRDSFSRASENSPAPSYRPSVNTTSNQPIVTYPENAVVPFTTSTPLYTYFPMPSMHPQGFPQEFSQRYQQNGQPIFMPIPVTFYNPSQVPIRQNEMPIVQ